MASYTVTVARKIFQTATIRVEAESEEEALELAPVDAAERDPAVSWTDGDVDEGSAFAEDAAPCREQDAVPLRRFTVQCGFSEPSCHIVAVDAATVDEAVRKAIELANDSGDWRRLDAGDTYVDAVCEGDGSPWDHPIPIPVRYTEQGEPPAIRVPDDVAAALDVRSGRVRIVRVRPDGTVTGDEIVTAVAADFPKESHDPIAERQRIRWIGTDGTLVEERIVPGTGDRAAPAGSPEHPAQPDAPEDAAHRPVTVVHTDGSCLGNPGAGGWAAVIDDGAAVREISGHEADATNNRMEMLAVIRALDAIKPGPRIRVVTDSQYVRNGITTWIAGWKRRNWRTAAGQPVRNIGLWQQLETAVERHGGRVTWQWVRGHAGNPGNDRADELARAAAAER